MYNPLNQAREPPTQRHECLAAAEREGLTIVRTYEERVQSSGSSSPRPPRSSATPI